MNDGLKAEIVQGEDSAKATYVACGVWAVTVVKGGETSTHKKKITDQSIEDYLTGLL